MWKMYKSFLLLYKLDDIIRCVLRVHGEKGEEWVDGDYHGKIEIKKDKNSTKHRSRYLGWAYYTSMNFRMTSV